MREEQMRIMQTLFIADLSLSELECLFACNIKDDVDFYCVLAYNISQADPSYFIERLPTYSGLRLRGAVFGLGLSPRRDQRQQAALKSLLTHKDPMIVAEAIDALRASEYTNLWPAVTALLSHESPFVKGAVARYARFSLPSDQAFSLLMELLNHEHAIVKQNAIDELAELGNVRAIDRIRGYLNDPDANIRRAALTAINSLSH